MSKKKILFFITTSYPYGKGESFIETEINYLSKTFDEIYIISNGLLNLHPVLFPENVKVEKFPYSLTKNEIFKSLNLLFTCTLWQEIFYLLFKYHKFPKWLTVKTIIFSLLYGNKLAKHINNYIKNNSFEQEDIFAYSYWFNDNSIGVSLLKKYYPKAKVFARVHSYDLYFYRSLLNYIPFKNFLFKKLDFVYFISDDAYNYSKNILKINEKNLAKSGVSRLGILQTKKQFLSEGEKTCL
ncbi:MAG: hypothetical protein HGB12_15795, partial [Bacteroidetes bacterium]|nr:hypothetical protein [Bacteroidota bacterium]